MKTSIIIDDRILSTMMNSGFGSRVDYDVLKNTLVGTDELHFAHIYVKPFDGSRTDPETLKHKASTGKFHSMLRSKGYSVHMNRILSEKPFYYSNAVDIVLTSMREAKKVDKIFFVVNSIEYVPLFASLREAGIKVVIVGTRCKESINSTLEYPQEFPFITPHQLIQGASQFIDLMNILSTIEFTKESVTDGEEN